MPEPKTNALTKRYFGNRVPGWAVLAGVAGLGVVWWTWRRRSGVATPSTTGNNGDGSTDTTGNLDSGTGAFPPPISGGSGTTGSGTLCPDGMLYDQSTGSCVAPGEPVVLDPPAATDPTTPDRYRPPVTTLPPAAKACPPGQHLSPLGRCVADVGGSSGPCHAGYAYDPHTDQCHPTTGSTQDPVRTTKPATVAPYTQSAGPGYAQVTIASLGKQGTAVRQAAPAPTPPQTPVQYVRNAAGNWVVKTAAVVRQRQLAGLGS